MKKKRDKILVIMLVIMMLIITLLLSSCDEVIQPEDKITVEEEKPTAGGTMTIGSLEPASLNPLTSNSKTYMDISRFLFEKLVDYDAKLKVVPVLAESWSFIEGTPECLLKLRDNLYWSDGQKVTAADVKYSLDTIKASTTSMYRDNLEHIYSYKVIDEKSISITFDQPFANAIDMLSFPVIPEHVFSKNPNAVPVSTGAYKITQYNKLKYMELEPNDKWLAVNTGRDGEGEAKQYIEKIKVIFINDSDAFSTAFQTRELDVLNTLEYDWEKYSELRNVNTYKYTSMSFDFIGLNHNSEIFKEKAVRKAMLHAINRSEIIDKYLLGNAVMADVPINPKSWLYDDKITKTIYSKVEAQSILKNAGFGDSNGDKVLDRNVDGTLQSLKFTLMTNAENDFRKKAVEDIKKNLEDVGFAVDIQYVAFADLMTAMQSKQFDAVLTGYNLSMTQDLSFAFHSSQILVGKNYYSYSNADFDNLLYQSYTTTNEELREEVFHKIQNVFVEEVPIISLFFREGAIVARNKIKGDIGPDTANPYRGINRWFVSKQNQ